MPRFIQMNPRNTFYRRDRGSLSLFPLSPFFLLLGMEEGYLFVFRLGRNWRGSVVGGPRNNETREKRGEAGHIYFPLDGSDTGSRVYTRELDATSRGDSGCRPVHAQAPKRHLNYRLRLFMSRRSPTPLAHLDAQPPDSLNFFRRILVSLTTKRESSISSLILSSFSILTNSRIFHFVNIFLHFDEESSILSFIFVNILLFFHFDEKSFVLSFILVNILLFLHFDEESSILSFIFYF